MDKNRRSFLKNLSSRTATLAAAAGTSSLAYVNSCAEDLAALKKEMNQKFAKTTTDLGNQINSLSNRLDGAALTLSYQQVQLYFIFLLLVISLMIDAGMTGVWLLT